MYIYVYMIYVYLFLVLVIHSFILLRFPIGGRNGWYRTDSFGGRNIYRIRRQPQANPMGRQRNKRSAQTLFQVFRFPIGERNRWYRTDSFGGRNIYRVVAILRGASILGGLHVYIFVSISGNIFGGYVDSVQGGASVAYANDLWEFSGSFQTHWARPRNSPGRSEILLDFRRLPKRLGASSFLSWVMFVRSSGLRQIWCYNRLSHILVSAYVFRRNIYLSLSLFLTLSVYIYIYI
jgi:hypothetical protein